MVPNENNITCLIYIQHSCMSFLSTMTSLWSLIFPSLYLFVYSHSLPIVSIVSLSFEGNMFLLVNISWKGGNGTLYYNLAYFVHGLFVGKLSLSLFVLYFLGYFGMGVWIKGLSPIKQWLMMLANFCWEYPIFVCAWAGIGLA